MSWLSNWKKRIELTIPDANIDSNLTNFPVLIYISAASGIGDVDASPVFDELTSDANRKKIAVTTSDGTTQCYVEIERWDDASEKAWLWVKVPSVLATGGATLYLYYDSTKADNTTYIGDTGDAAAQSVWDANFVGVWHMAQDPNGDGAGAILDSTSNANHGTPAGTMTTADLVDGAIGKRIDLDGTDDYINIGNSNDFNPGTGPFTVEATIKTTDATARQEIVGKQKGSGDWEGWGFRVSQTLNDQHLFAFLREDGLHLITRRGDTSLQNNTDYYVTFTYDGSESASGVLLYIDGGRETESTEQDTLSATCVSTVNAHIGSSGDAGALYFDGGLDEIRISVTERSAAWIKATYYSNTDAIATFGTAISFVFSNPVPADLAKSYGTITQLYLTTTVSGGEPNCIYDATFYNAYDDSVIGTMVSGIQNNQPAGVVIDTPSGIDYQWYVIASSSGIEDTSDTYTFTNRFLYEGYVTEKGVPVDRVVRLYYRDTGELVDSTTSSGVNGYYKMGAIENDQHYIVVLDDAGGESYNALILDKLSPVEE